VQVSRAQRIMKWCAASGKGTPFIACRLSQSSLYVARLSMIPKSGYQLSEKIMLKKARGIGRFSAPFV
jgi:hypothetical protein